MAARRRSQRRLRGTIGQRRGRRGDPEGDEKPGAARRRHPHARPYRELAGARAGARHPRHRRRARSRRWSTKPAGNFPGKIAVGIDAKGGKVAVEGWAEASRTRRHRAGARNSRAPALPRSSIPTSTATASWPASTGTSTLELADAVSIPVIASGGLASIDDIVRMTAARCGKARRRDLRPRAL